MLKRHIPTAAKGAFDPKKLRLMDDRTLVNIATELSEIIKLSQGDGAQNIEAGERRNKLMAEFGLTDFAKVRKQVGQEYNRRYSELAQKTTAADLKQMLADIEFERTSFDQFQPAKNPPLDLNDPKTVADIDRMVEVFGVTREQ